MASAAINGIHLAYADLGPRDGLPIILLHAFPLRGAMWQAQADALIADLGCRVIVPDLRGFGGSDVPPGPYPMELFAQDTLALADALGIDTFVLGGISLGGYITFATLRQAAHRIRGVILADTRAGADSEGERSNRTAMADSAERDGSASTADVMLPRLLSPKSINHPESANAVRAMITSNSPAGIAATARGMALRPDSTELLAQITCPALIIVGELDLTTPIHEARTMFEHIPEAKLEVLRDAGHLSNLESIADFNLALEHFLQGLPPV